MQDLQFDDEGYSRRGNILVSTLEDLLPVDVFVTFPAMHSVRVKAVKTSEAAVEEREKVKMHYHEKKSTPGYFRALQH
jgi:phage head maturation protease